MTRAPVFEQLRTAVGAVLRQMANRLFARWLSGRSPGGYPVGRQVAVRLVSRWLSGWSPGGCPVTRGLVFEQLRTAVGAVGRQLVAAR